MGFSNSRGAGRAARLVLVGLLFVFPVVLAAGCSPGGRGRAADLHWLETRLPKLHKNLFFELSEAAYGRALDGLRQRVDGLDDEQYYVALMQVIALLGDGHTSVRLPGEVTRGYGQYPLDLFVFSEGVYVIRASAALPHLVGCRIVSVDGMPIDNVMERVATIIAFANDASVCTRAPWHLNRPEVLYGLGVTGIKDQATFVFAGVDGTELELQIRAVAPPVDWTTGAVSIPIWLTNSAVIWHTYLAAERTLYIQYNQCTGDLKQATQEIVALLDSRPVERIVFDMRRNSGGNSLVAQGLINTLGARPETREPGHLFVVVGRSTYSSAILNTYDFRRQTNAVFVGEPTSAKPNRYGEVRTAELPHSGITVQYSTKYFEMDPGSDEPWFMPDVVVEQTAEAFFAGRDPVLEAVLRYEVGGSGAAGAGPK